MQPGERGHQHDNQAERARGVAMRHLTQRLAVVKRPTGESRIDRIAILERAARSHVTVARRPVGTSEAGIGQPHECTEHDDECAQDECGQRERTKRRDGAHRVQPMCESFRSFFRSAIMPRGSVSVR